MKSGRRSCFYQTNHFFDYVKYIVSDNIRLFTHTHLQYVRGAVKNVEQAQRRSQNDFNFSTSTCKILNIVTNGFIAPHGFVPYFNIRLYVMLGSFGTGIKLEVSRATFPHTVRLEMRRRSIPVSLLQDKARVKFEITETFLSLLTYGTKFDANFNSFKERIFDL